MPTVLLVERDAESARRYSESLLSAGFRVEVAAPDVDRQDLAPNVVVLSVPRLERSLLRVLAHGRLVPRIVLSSEATDAARAAEFECSAVLIRPVMYDDLIKEVRRVLKGVDASHPA